MNRFASNYGLPARTFSAAVLQACQSYSWPGNLRALEKFVKRYLVSGENGTTRFGFDSEPAADESTGADLEPSESKSEVSATRSLLHSVREEAERNAITTALDQAKWNRTVAARLLNVSYRTLLYKIEHYGMSPPRDGNRVKLRAGRQGN
jgi:two-component system response regulator AtoC